MSSIEQRRIAELERAVANRDAMIRELKGIVATLIGRVEELEARLNQNSDNSDLPPSANPLNAPKSAKRHTGRKPGGQPGHRGHYRSVAVPDLVVEHHPIACTHCEASFTGSEQEVSDPLRHQITEIPPVQPFITEHRLHRLRCGRCRRVTRAPWPQGVPSGHFGHRIVALVAMLSGRYRITRREMAALLEDGFGVKLSVGTVQALCEQAARALKAPYEEVAAQVITEPTVHADETGWWHRGRRHWLWTVGTKRGVVFRLDKGRGHEARTKLLPDYYEGIVHTDRWSAYSRHERRQLCHAHLLRSWRAISESKKPDVAALGERGVSETERMLRLHREFREGSLRPALGCCQGLRGQEGRKARHGSQCEVGLPLGFRAYRWSRADQQ
ncbi:Transposase IS66 family protein [compost metagenome]